MLLYVVTGLIIGGVIGVLFLIAEMSDDDEDGNEKTY